MKNPRTRRLTSRYFYSWVMPGVTILLVLIIAQFVSRPLVFRSAVVDFVVRMWVAGCYCAAYIILGNLDKYGSWLYGGKYDRRENQGDFLVSLWNAGLGLGLGFVVSLTTWWVIQAFLPIMKDLGLLISIVNGLICSMPLIAQGKSIIF